MPQEEEEKKKDVRGATSSPIIENQAERTAQRKKGKKNIKGATIFISHTCQGEKGGGKKRINLSIIECREKEKKKMGQLCHPPSSMQEEEKGGREETVLHFPLFPWQRRGKRRDNACPHHHYTSSCVMRVRKEKGEETSISLFVTIPRLGRGEEGNHSQGDQGEKKRKKGDINYIYYLQNKRGKKREKK